MLARCSRLFGGFQLETAPPEIGTHRDAFVRHGVLYDRHRAILPSSALLREYGPLSLVNGPVTSEHNPGRPKRILDEPLYWLGVVHPHYGHFMASTLSRLWAWPQGSCRIAYTGPPGADALFATPFAGPIFSALGLTSDDFVAVGDFDLLREVVLPAPSLVENSIVHTAFGDMTRRIAGRIVPNFQRAVDPRPVYLSKSRLAGGVSRVLDEDAVSDVLARAGVLVVHPETLPFAQQVALWQRHDTFIGSAGSALHTAAFATGKRIVSFSHTQHVESNQVLIDREAGHESTYLYPTTGVDILPAGGGFHRSVRLADPEAVASALLRAVGLGPGERESFSAVPRPPADTAARFLYPDEPFGTNLALGRPARISSSDPAWQRRGGAADAGMAVSGLLSDSYHFHTLNEPQPWWEVDLEATCLINEVRVFNRHDVAQGRASRLLVLFSLDRDTWETVGQRSDPGIFDGLDSHPYRWLAPGPMLARFVRLQLPDHDMLHLNQVEIFGVRTDRALC